MINISCLHPSSKEEEEGILWQEVGSRGGGQVEHYVSNSGCFEQLPYTLGGYTQFSLQNQNMQHYKRIAVRLTDLCF